ncbi:MAG: transaldolase [Anaerolineae bacterium]|nr:transaldolase [Anaerolineae bacterium]
MDAKTNYASGATPESVLERFLKTSPGLEVWWDSSPLVYPNWSEKLVSQAAPEKRDVLAAQLKKWYDPADAASTLFAGVTTNPPLSLAAMQNDPPRWQAWIKDYQTQHPKADVEDVFWALYKEIVRLGAEAFLPLFESSGYLKGHLSGQVDPRRFFDGELMLRQGLELAALAPNVMVKIPGTREGVDVIRELTARGISTNCTAGYIVPQFVAVAEAVQAGLAEARAKGVDLSHWRSVVTYMSARWENSPVFVEQAQRAGITLTEEDRRWAGVALFKKAYRVYRERAYPSKMLVCSVRMGPNDKTRCAHLEEMAGASAVFTLPPNFLGELFTDGENLQFESRVWQDIPAEIMQRLQKIPYFKESYEPDGMKQKDFNTIAPLVSTFNEFSGATQKMVDFVKERMV